MTAIRTTLFLLWCSALFAVADTEPLNVLVGDMYFPRGKTWTWEAPAEGSTAATRFIAEEGTEIRIYITDRSPKSSIESWKNYFPEPGDRVAATEERSIMHGRKVVWFTIRGTYVFGKLPTKYDHLFIAVMIENGNEWLMVRLSGPNSGGSKALPDFKRMIDEALAERSER